MPALSGAKRLRRPVDKKDQKKTAAQEYESERPGDVRQIARLHGSRRRYARLPQYAVPQTL